MCFTDRKSILQRIICCVSHWRELARTYITKQKLCSNSRHCLQWFVYLNMPLNIKDCVQIYIQIDLAFLYSNFVSGTHFLHKLYMYTKKRGKLESGMQSLEGSSDRISTVTHKNRQLGVVIFSLGLGQGKIFIFFQCGSGGKKYARNRGVFFFFSRIQNDSDLKVYHCWSRIYAAGK